MDYVLEEESIDIMSGLTAFVFDSGLIYVLLFLFAILILLIVKNIVKSLVSRNKYFDHIIYTVRLPKDKPDDHGKGFSVQELHEEISKGETVFASVGGMRAERSISAWFFGRSDHFSFEIVATHKKISFYIIAPRQQGRYIEQQVHAHYPDAVIEEVDDYNVFHPNGVVLAATTNTIRDFIFPIKTYKKMETDPMNSTLNVMSKLEDNEGIAVQYVVRSAKGGWHREAAKVVREVHQGKNIKEVLRNRGAMKVFIFIAGIISAIQPKKKDNLNTPIKKLTAMEEDMLKGIEEKNGKAGLDVNLRIVVSAQDKGRAQLYLDNLAGAYSQYNYYEYGNSFRNKVKRGNQTRILRDFIFRRFNQGLAFLLNTEEMASLFHFPLKNAETPNIFWLSAKQAPAPTTVPDEGVLLGYNVFRGVKKEIKIKRPDRRRHMYIIGKSGGGKSQFIAGTAIQDILNGDGVCVLDPHGDLIHDILERIPPERADDVILFRPADFERPMALNLIEYDARYPEQKTFVINEIINIFDKLYDLKSTGGPIFEQYMRNALLLIMSDPESGSTLMEVPKVLADPAFRNMKLNKCADPTVVDFWRKEAEKAGGDAALANVVPYITSKLTQFISNDTMRPIIGQQKSSFNLRDVMDEQKILLIDLSKGAIGEMNAFLLGMILIGKILMSSLSRTDIPEEKRKDFYLYIDEFQNFTTNSVCSILSEARKYGLNLIIAHQYLGQLVKGQDTSIRDAVFGNVGTWVLFKIGSDDAAFMEKEFAPVFNQFDLVNIEKFTTYTKLLVDNSTVRPFSMGTPWPLPGIKRPEIAEKIRALSRLKYGQDRKLIEAEIKRRTSLI